MCKTPFTIGTLQIIAMQSTNISTNVLPRLCTRKSNTQFLEIVRYIAAVFMYCATMRVLIIMSHEILYIPPSDSYEHSYDKTHDRTNPDRTIALVHVPSSDHFIICAILSHYLTTLGLILQQS